jgi:hypothetical protein
MAKNWTEEERKAFGAKMKAARQNKNPQNEVEETKTVEQPVIEEKETISSADYADLIKQIEELKQMQWQSLIANAAPQATVAGGKLTGTFEKYSTSAEKYPSPVERLMVEPKLARFAFPLNYELNYDVSVSSYTTIDGIRTKEPKFSLELVRILLDEETGEPTNGRYIICRMIMHEDPDAALVIAHDNGLEVEEETEERFLNEMRYIRMRDWLLECFYPAPIKQETNRKDMVIGNKLVTFYEVNGENGVSPGSFDWKTMTKL